MSANERMVSFPFPSSGGGVSGMAATSCSCTAARQGLCACTALSRSAEEARGNGERVPASGDSLSGGGGGGDDGKLVHDGAVSITS